MRICILIINRLTNMDFNDEIDFNEKVAEEWVKLIEAAENNQLPDQNKLEPGPEHLEVLSKYFGHTGFRPLQWEIISSIIIDKRDVCAIMCTGYGKSLCFQFPSVFTGGLTLVISPLIALMQDQVLSLTVANIPACLLGTAQQHTSQVIADIFANKYSLIYLTPEFCTGELGTEMLNKMSKELSVTLIAIDEAHCISSWGHDFRYQYRKLGFFHYTFPSVPIIAMTATATTKVRDDIVETLQLRNPLLVCSGFDRPNLYFEVFPKSDKAIFADLSKTMVFRDNAWKFTGPTIVYCITRKQTEEVSDVLRGYGIKSRCYHAGLALKLRKETHEQFVRDQIDVVVATIAFGMGIDKPDIANIVHYGASKSIENYYQEVGRAGRDGNPARCVAFFCEKDFWILRKLEERIIAHAEERAAKMEKMERYLDTRECRRKFILNYFEDSKVLPVEPQPNCCDNCTKRRYNRRSDTDIYEGLDDQGRFNFSNYVRIILNTVASLDVPFGMTTFIAFIRGSQEGKLYSYQDHPLYGVGKEKPNPWWKSLVKMLIEERYLREVPHSTYGGFPYNSLAVTPDGSRLFNEITRKGATFLRSPPREIMKLLKAKAHKPRKSDKNISPSANLKAESPEDIEERLKIYNELVNKRTELAAELDCMPYMVASNSALMAMASFKPRTLNNMRDLNLDGFTQVKLRKFGNHFLNIIAKMTVNDEKKTTANEYMKKLPIKDILDRYPLPKRSLLNLSAGVSCALYQSGLNVEDISVKRKITLQTVIAHLIGGITVGYPIKITDVGVTKQYRDLIVKAFYKKYPEPDFSDVKTLPIKNECPPEVTYDHIKAVLGYLQVRYHLEKLKIPYEEFENFTFNEVCAIKPVVKRVNETITQVPKNDLKLDNTGESKKCEIEYNSLIMDSPPHTIVSGNDEQEVFDVIEVTEIQKKSPKKDILKLPKKKLQPPPWLVYKKIN